LIFILLFGLFLNNLDGLKNYKWIKKVKPIELNKEVQKFKEIVGEGTFLIRALLFVLFGFFIGTSDLLNPKTIIWSLSIVIAIFLIRIFHLKLSRLPIFPLAFIAPRGLITILLFLAISPQLQIELINKSFIIQVILFSSFLLMLGSIMSKKQ